VEVGPTVVTVATKGLLRRKNAVGLVLYRTTVGLPTGDLRFEWHSQSNRM